jgi:hypothetical protein
MITRSGTFFVRRTRCSHDPKDALFARSEGRAVRTIRRTRCSHDPKDALFARSVLPRAVAHVTNPLDETMHLA